MNIHQVLYNTSDIDGTLLNASDDNILQMSAVKHQNAEQENADFSQLDNQSNHSMASMASMAKNVARFN